MSAVFSVLLGAFSAVGRPDGDNTCDGGVANFTIKSCGYNLTAYMAAKCLGEPSCNFTNDDLYASGFVSHQCPAYNASLYMTFGFFGTCCHPIVLCPTPGSHEWNLLQPSRALALNSAVVLQMAGDQPSCSVQLHVSHNQSAAYSPLGIAVAPGQLIAAGTAISIASISVHVVVYGGGVINTSYTPYLEYLSGCSGVLASDPRNTYITPPDFFDQFGFQCPQSYRAELPATPVADFYVTFGGMVPMVFAAGSNASLALVLPNLQPGDSAYVGEITALLVNSTGAGNRFYRLLNGSPCLNNTLAAYACTCSGPCAGHRTVASEVLIDSGMSVLRRK